MAKLFISNPTKQNHLFAYRNPQTMPGVPGKIIEKVIPAGGQAQVHEDAPIDTLLAIVEQHAQYGLVEAKFASKMRGRFLTYTIDRPQQSDQIESQVVKVEEIAQEQADDALSNGIAAVSSKIDEVEQFSEKKTTNLSLQVTEVTKNGAEPSVNREFVVEKPGHNGNDRRNNDRQRQHPGNNQRRNIR